MSDVRESHRALQVVQQLEHEVFDVKPHIACCVEDKTYCGAPFHPEMIAGEDVDEDDACEACVDTLYLCMRPEDGPAQYYICPVSGQRCVDPVDEPGQGKSNGSS